MLRFVVLLKQGTFEFVACEEGDVFRVAESENAGICGVFESRSSAETFLMRQRTILAASAANAESVASSDSAEKRKPKSNSSGNSF